MTCKISLQAAEDIENIWLYTFKTWSKTQADRYINLIFEEIEYLTQNPNSGKDFGQIRKNYKRSKVKSHLVFYKVIEKENTIEIIRILHERMDIESRLND